MTEATQSKAQAAYHHIKAAIAAGTYGPGYRLVLGSIAAELGSSVVPVREAIRLLESEGLVTFERNVGAQVVLLDEDEYVTTMETLAIVEGAATGLSAPTITADQIARAREINARMRETLESFEPARFTALNLEFHAVLFEGCPNPHLLDIVHRGWRRLGVLRDSTFRYIPGRARESVDEHDDLLSRIEAGQDPLEIELAARRHRTSTLDAFRASHVRAPHGKNDE